MSVRIQGDQAAGFQLMPMVFEDTEDGLSHNLRSGTFDANGHDARSSYVSEDATAAANASAALIDSTVR
jgi:hypothetical protein